MVFGGCVFLVVWFCLLVDWVLGGCVLVLVGFEWLGFWV